METTEQLEPGNIESGGSFTELDVRSWRNEIDGMIAASVSQFTPSRQISLCTTSLQRAKAWLGESLKAIGTENPYPNSSDPTNKVIEPQAEHGHVGYSFLEYDTQLERVKLFRKCLSELILSMEKKQYGLGYRTKEESCKNLIEAKHWLGWELDYIRRSQEGGEYSEPSFPKSLF